MPYVVAKIACSNDYFTVSNKKNITNNYSREVSHLLRYQFDSILVSSKTANSDNSKLSCRINGLENFSPRRIIIDKDLKINKKSPVMNDKYKNNTIILILFQLLVLFHIIKILFLHPWQFLIRGLPYTTLSKHVILS